MIRYTGYIKSDIPVLAEDEWALTTDTGEYGEIVEFHWGGEAIATTAMRTDIVRNSTEGVTPTAGDVNKRHPFSAANRIGFTKSWGTQPAARVAGGLWGESWNAHGGVVRWLAAPGEEFVVLGSVSGDREISCVAGVGTGTSTYGVIWVEM